MTAEIIPFPSQPRNINAARDAFINFRRGLRDFWMSRARELAKSGASKYCIRLYVTNARLNNHLIIDARKTA